MKQNYHYIAPWTCTVGWSKKIKNSDFFLDSYKNLLIHEINNLEKIENFKYILRFHNAPEKYEHLIEITRIEVSRHESAC